MQMGLLFFEWESKRFVSWKKKKEEKKKEIITEENKIAESDE